SNEAVPAGDLIVSLPARALTAVISSKRIESRRSGPRNSSTLVSSRALPSTVRPLNVAAHNASAPIVTFQSAAASCGQQERALRFGKSFDRIAQRGPWNRRTVHKQVRFQPVRIGLSCLTQCPTHRLLNEVLTIGV